VIRRVGARNLAKRYTALKEFIQENYPCGDCGAKAGEPCRPDFGCDEYDRLPIGDKAVLVKQP